MAEREKSPRRAVTEAERRMARALGFCRFLPGSADKRFARQLSEAAEWDECFITDRQGVYLRQLVRRYRGQIAADVVALAEESGA